MNKITYGDGFLVVRMDPDDVSRFNSRWPASKLNEDLYHFFEFDYDGNLVDLWGRKSMRSAKRVDLAKYDGPELLALSQDAWKLAEEYFGFGAAGRAKSNPTYKDLYFVDNVNKTMKLVRYGSPEHELYHRLQSSSRMLIPAASNMFHHLIASGYKIVNPSVHKDMYFVDHVDKTMKLVRYGSPEHERYHRLQSSSRMLIPAASDTFRSLTASGYKIVNPYMGFHKLAKQLERKGAYDPRALAAWIGRRKYGKATFQAMAAAGRKAARRNPYTDMDGMALVDTGTSGAKPVWKTLSFSGYRNTSEALSDFAMWLRSKIPHLRAYKLKSHGEIVLQNVIPESMSVAEVHHRIQRDIDYVKRRV